MANINDFYVPDYSQSTAEVAALQEKIAELEMQNVMAQQQTQPNELELMERSYQLAAKYMGNGKDEESHQSDSEEDKENGKYSRLLRLDGMWYHLSELHRKEALRLLSVAKR